MVSVSLPLGEIVEKWPEYQASGHQRQLPQTNLPGVYAIGISPNTKGKTKLIAGVLQVNHAMASPTLSERNNLHVHSSSLFEDK